MYDANRFGKPKGETPIIEVNDSKTLRSGWSPPQVVWVRDFMAADSGEPTRAVSSLTFGVPVLVHSKESLYFALQCEVYFQCCISVRVSKSCE